MKLYHITKDLSLKSKTFTPRIPLSRMPEEDDTVKRICASSSIKSAFEGFPEKIAFILRDRHLDRTNYLAFYEMDADEYLGPTDIKDKVPDAEITCEHWILKEVEASPKLIKVTDIKIGKLVPLDKGWFRRIDELHFENDTEDFDRIESMVFISRKRLSKAKKAYRDTEVRFEVVEEESISFPYVLEDRFEFYGHNTSRKYNYIHVNVYVPKGVSMAKLWYLDSLQNAYARKKRFSIVNDREIEEYQKTLECFED